MKPALNGNVLLIYCGGYTVLCVCQNSHNRALTRMNMTVYKLSLHIKKKKLNFAEFCHEEIASLMVMQGEVHPTEG